MSSLLCPSAPFAEHRTGDLEALYAMRQLSSQTRKFGGRELRPWWLLFQGAELALCGGKRKGVDWELGKLPLVNPTSSQFAQSIEYRNTAHVLRRRRMKLSADVLQR